MNDSQRCDVLLVEKGLAPSRTRAQAMIKAGLVFCEGNLIQKTSQLVSCASELEVRGQVCPYVSRGGFKLEKALQEFSVDVAHMTCLDIGASTGGFTDVLLKNGAKMVYALDVGTSQLSDILRNDPRVVVMEQTNARSMTKEMFDTALDLAVMDVSFISIRLILPAVRDTLDLNGSLIALIKPQFEAGKKAIGKNGIVTDRKVHERVLLECIHYAFENQWAVLGLTYSPITGSDGNIEYLIQLKPDMNPVIYDTGSLRSLVDTAFKAHK